MQYILEVDGITKDFMPPLTFSKLARLELKHRKPIRALSDVSFYLERGQILGILGPNGAGKTTLLKIIATLILPDKGTVSIQAMKWPHNAVKPYDVEEKIKCSIGLVAEEERSFYWRLTGRQNLEFFAALYGLDKRTIKIRLDELFESFHIDYPDKRFDAYSTGIKRRFALMRGVLHNPELLLLDEPTKSLDYTTALNLRNFIKEKLVKAEGKTVIFTTHNMDEALRLADLFMILHKGKVFAFGTLDALRIKVNNPQATLGEVFIKLTEGS